MHVYLKKKNKWKVSSLLALREKCPYLEFSGLYFLAFGLNTDQKKSGYKQFLRIVESSIKNTAHEAIIFEIEIFIAEFNFSYFIHGHIFGKK